MLWSGLIGILIGFGTGVCATIWLVYGSGLTFAQQVSIQVDPLEIISLIVTVIVAVYITQKINKRTEESRTTKELLIKRLGNLEELIMQKARLIYAPKPFAFVQQATKTIRTSVSEELSLLVRHTMITADNPTARDLTEKSKDLWHLLTFVPPTGSETPSSNRVDEGKIIYSGETIEQIAENLAQIKTLITDLQIEVNSCED